MVIHKPRGQLRGAWGRGVGQITILLYKPYLVKVTTEVEEGVKNIQKFDHVVYEWPLALLIRRKNAIKNNKTLEKNNVRVYIDIDLAKYKNSFFLCSSGYLKKGINCWSDCFPFLGLSCWDKIYILRSYFTLIFVNSFFYVA